MILQCSRFHGGNEGGWAITITNHYALHLYTILALAGIKGRIKSNENEMMADEMQAGIE